ncbi:MAG: ATP-binding cassette domain-containing protein [Clostridiales bacterium]|nr:ATP-binding cassette domain-containing protein [Clostridiales bacterium]
MRETISVKHLSKAYGDHDVLHDFSAEIPLCGVTVLRGASGIGKTTLFRLLLGLERPDAGEIRGMDGRKPAVVFQEDRLLPWATALENVSLISGEETAILELSRLGLGENMRQLPKELSGGMKRRVAIARALAYGGDILFLDEPFTGLDEDNKRAAARALAAAGVPILVITHDDAEAELFGAYCELSVG